MKNMNKADKLHKEVIREILDNGYLDENPRPKYADGTPAHTLSVNQMMQKYDISKGEFPITTLRPIAWKNAVKEILWIYQKQTSSLQVLEDEFDIHWWNEWESKDRPGTIGQRYGATVRKHDSMNNLLNDIKNDPYGRRHIICLWQEEDFKETDGLKPCAFMTMWNVRGKYLDMTLVQRSSDFLTAGNINQMQYVALLMMVAKATGYEPGVFCHFLQNVQIYDRHIENANIMYERESIPCKPHFVFTPKSNDFYSFKLDDFKLVDYPLAEIKEKNPQLVFELGI